MINSYSSIDALDKNDSGYVYTHNTSIMGEKFVRSPVILNLFGTSNTICSALATASSAATYIFQ